MDTDSPKLTARFEEALIFASRLHAKQVRKTTAIPYISHLLGVTAIVLEAGGDEDEAIAALLHDAVEDQGGRETLEEVRKRFGNRVASIVEACSDSNTIPKPPWRIRKETYIDHLRNAPSEVLLVSLADKIHNARSILRDLRHNGEQTWSKFKGGKTGTIWYYKTLVTVFSDVSPHPFVKELERIVRQIQTIADEN